LFAAAKHLEGRGVIEVYAPRGISDAQRAEVEILADAARARRMICVLVVPAPAGIDGFRVVNAFGVAEESTELRERLERWMELATGGGFSFSADGLLLATHLCKQEGKWWARLARESMLIAGAARLPVVTSWAVQGANAQVMPLHESDDVPAEWRRPPRVWPSAAMAARLAELRRTYAEPDALPAATDRLRSGADIDHEFGAPPTGATLTAPERTDSYAVDHQR
jgi:hypothetical protein